MSSLRTRDAGDSALLLDLDDAIDTRVNGRAIAIAREITAAAVAGVRDVVPTIRSVAVYFDPLAADLAGLATLVAGAGGRASSAPGGRTFEVPVVYGGEAGPDLAAVAAFAGLTEAQVVELHAARPYRVFMLGFLPGFPYLGLVDERIAAPRHASPRLRVAAGSVGIAGRQTGIYPRESPGGWQIIGRAGVSLFDPVRTPPALLAPGDAVRFVPAGAGDLPVRGGPGLPGCSSLDADRGRIGAEGGHPASRRVTVLAPGLLTTIQDAGRWGHQASGVPVAGPLDPFSHRLANALVGNERGAAALEITLSGPELRLEDDAYVALTGADLDPTLDGVPMPMHQALAGRAGSILRFGLRRRGARSYLAFDGGVSVAPVLGSRATHVLSGLGGLRGRALKAGDTISLGDPRGEITRRRYTPEPRAGSPVTTLRVIAGPQDDVFPAPAIDRLVHSAFAIAPESNRMGYRLAGARLPTAHDGTMISTSTFTGAIQVPPSGEPVLLMADRQTTGGYPQLATVITADLGAAGQLAPGDRVAFELCSRGAAIAALVRQEGVLLALE